MNPNTATTLDKLVDGDRFYLAGKKDKDVLILKQLTPVGKNLYATATQRGLPDSYVYNKNWKDAAAVKVVFLRHKEPIA